VPRPSPFPQEIQCRDPAKIHSVVVAYGNPVIAELRVINLGTVSRGIDALVPGVQILIDKNAPVYPKAGPGKKMNVGDQAEKGADEADGEPISVQLDFV
jgi:hypothetical protein